MLEQADQPEKGIPKPCAETHLADLPSSYSGNHPIRSHKGDVRGLHWIPSCRLVGWGSECEELARNQAFAFLNPIV